VKAELKRPWISPNGLMGKGWVINLRGGQWRVWKDSMS
jgi:hypothetical protein